MIKINRLAKNQNCYTVMNKSISTGNSRFIVINPDNRNNHKSKLDTVLKIINKKYQGILKRLAE